MRLRRCLAVVSTSLALVVSAAALDETEKELERYRQMLKDGPRSNPAMLDADRGEALWKEKQPRQSVKIVRVGG